MEINLNTFCAATWFQVRNRQDYQVNPQGMGQAAPNPNVNNPWGSRVVFGLGVLGGVTSVVKAYDYFTPNPKPSRKPTAKSNRDSSEEEYFNTEINIYGQIVPVGTQGILNPNIKCLYYGGTDCPTTRAARELLV